MLARYGAKHRKRSDNPASAPQQTTNNGTVIAVGALIDGIPESIVIGLSLLHGGAVSIVAAIAIFLSNLAEGSRARRA